MTIKKYYTGIGSRTAPEWALEVARKIGIELGMRGYILRSGAAEGMDTAFETGCNAVNGEKYIYLPWQKFNNHPSQYFNQDELAIATAMNLHPNWSRLSQGARKLHARNVYQIVGHDWKHPSRFIICYSNHGKGGTMQAVRLANQMGITVIDYCDMSYDGSLWDLYSEGGITEIVQSILNQVLIYKYKLEPKELEGKAFYCKLFNNYRYDGKCNDMACEFCDEYYDDNRKVWWYHAESDSIFLATHADMDRSRDTNIDAGLCVNIDNKIKTRVVNAKNNEYDVYIGRGSDYGNPYKIGVDGNRKEVIEKFYNYLHNNVPLQKKIMKLRGLRLGCYCAPKDCHGDIIAEFIENNVIHDFQKQGD
jgi:hypothetical protein